MNWDDLQGEKNFSGFFAYRQSKLGTNLFTIELAERLKGTYNSVNSLIQKYFKSDLNKEFGVTVVSLHPGTVKSEILRTDENDSFGSKLLVGIARPFFSLLGVSAAQGALTSIYCATNDQVPNHTGAYFEYNYYIKFFTNWFTNSFFFSKLEIVKFLKPLEKLKIRKKQKSFGL